MHIDTELLSFLHVSPLVEVAAQPCPDHLLHHINATLLGGLRLLVHVLGIFLLQCFDLRQDFIFKSRSHQLVFCLLPVLAKGGKDFLHEADVAFVSEPQDVYHLYLHVPTVGIACLPGLEVGSEHV